MTDLFKSNENEFYIKLSQERYYFPGEDISGDVILDLKKATKTNNIRITLEGTFEIGGRSISLFSKSVHVAESPEGDQKSHYLEPYTHRFPFRITIPSSKEHKVPSTLEITKLLKVSYRLVAIYNKAFSVFEKFCPTTNVSINILEDINAGKAGFSEEQRIEKELLLSGETTRKVKVFTIVGKRAAVKGDVIPITLTIQHIGVMVRDKALSIQLLRSVYYGKNKSELFGPKVIRQITSNIEILGPTSFTKTFDMRLLIPSNICPTVDESGSTFKIEYSLRVSINLNEENPHRPETEGDIVIFNVPFVIGTYPRLKFTIDDDDDDDDDDDEAEEDKFNTVENGSYIDDTDTLSEYAQVAEKIKDLDLGSPTLLQQSPSQQSNSIARINPISTLPESSFDSIQEPAVSTSYPLLDGIPNINSTPKLENASKSKEGEPSFCLNKHSATPLSEHSTLVQQQHPPESPSYHTAKLKISPSEIYNDYQPTSPMVPRHNDSVAPLRPSDSTSTVHSHGGLGRQESVRWIVRNQDAPTPAIVSPSIPPQSSPICTSQGVFVMPTPSFSETTFIHSANNSPPYHHKHYQLADQSNYSYASSLPQQHQCYSHGDSLMPMPQQLQSHHQFPPYTNNNYSYQNDAPPYPPYSHTIEFPQPQSQHHPQPFSGGFMDMPSHQTYSSQPQYPYYHQHN